ncbi:MAG: hypothetical protein K9G83_05975 [Hyphomonadaceae bacterium]|jgi:hypothetical protein|nr:hypothetical protein [Hyphomonadaceae bacterium]
MQPAELTVENAEMSTSLGAGFWTGWAAGMAATLGAFAGAVYLFMHSGSPGGPMVGGVIVVAFTLALIAIANIPNMIRRKRGFGERMRAPYRRYAMRFLPAMFAYVFLLMAAVSYANSAEPTGWVAWAVAIAPAIPLIFAIRAIFLLPREEDDEYQRDRINRAYAWATGATLMVCTTVGFLDMFGVVPHLELWVIFPMWAIFMGVARCLPLGGAR